MSLKDRLSEPTKAFQRRSMSPEERVRLAVDALRSGEAPDAVCAALEHDYPDVSPLQWKHALARARRALALVAPEEAREYYYAAIHQTVEDAMATQAVRDRVAALTLFGKTHGLLVDRQEVKLESRMSDEELEAELARALREYEEERVH